MLILLNIKEAAEFLRLAKSSLYGLVYQRRIPFRKHGSRLVFAQAELEAWSDLCKIGLLQECVSAPARICAKKELPARRGKLFEKRTTTQNEAVLTPKEIKDGSS